MKFTFKFWDSRVFQIEKLPSGKVGISKKSLKLEWFSRECGLNMMKSIVAGKITRNAYNFSKNVIL